MKLAIDNNLLSKSFKINIQHVFSGVGKLFEIVSKFEGSEKQGKRY